MKKIVYIGILFLALVATSCSKEEVVVNDDNNRAPEWNSNCIEKKSGSLGSNGSSDEGDAPVVNPTPVSGEAPTVDITDPNNDPDGKKKKH